MTEEKKDSEKKNEEKAGKKYDGGDIPKLTKAAQKALEDEKEEE